MVQPIQIGHAIKPVSVLRMVFPPHGALSMTIVCSLDEALN
jgi:CBS-domain-containing membrane protein